MIARDARLVAFNRCLRLGYLAHFTREWVTLRPFWSEDFRAAFDVFGSPAAARVALGLFFAATTVQLTVSVIGLWRPTRLLILLSTLGLMLEALVMPIGIPNHVALLLAALTFQAVMLLWRRDEAATVRGLCAILLTSYACAALHKMNDGFADVLDGVLGQRLPHALVRVLALATVGVELGLPALALFSRRARPLSMLGLLALHFPMNSTLGAIDYPWIATSFYPLFFGAQEWTELERELGRLQRWPLFGAAGGVLSFVLLTPRDLFIYQAAVGVVVSALWGYCVPSLLRRALGLSS
jgi:hypothetical protein